MQHPLVSLMLTTAMWCWLLKSQSLSSALCFVTCPAAWSGLWIGPAGKLSNMQILSHHLDVVTSATKICLLPTIVSYDVLRQWGSCLAVVPKRDNLCSAAVLVWCVMAVSSDDSLD